ncbi:zinc-binding dehydrogenase [Actinoplanes sp. NPDC051411]|uniref:zinc-binding dehydrogenase n=1 Tax=Actinoplanes sp. NPDC051411 TaxID=3155522 RepID=UPI00343AF92F
MRAVQIDRHGGIDVLTLREVPVPVPAAGEVLVRTVASSINPVDWKTRGVGSLAVQLARRSGARVDGLVSRLAHVPAVRELGAELVTDRVADLPAAAYDAVFDTASVHPGPALIPGGRYRSITDDPLPADIPGAVKIQIREDVRGLAELVSMVDAGELHVRVGAYHRVDDVHRAHRVFEAGGLVGKVVLTF